VIYSANIGKAPEKKAYNPEFFSQLTGRLTLFMPDFTPFVGYNFTIL
jgi:hypothetical protein